MSSVEHILLYSIMLLLSYVYDRQCRVANNDVYFSYRKNTSWITLLLLGVLFVVTEGLRYGRGGDQIGNYGPGYLKCMNPNFTYDSEKLFVWFNQVVYQIDFTRDFFVYGLIFVAYALVFWLCLCSFFEDFKSKTRYFFVFAIIATNYITEWTIRQGLSFGLILLSLHYLQNKKYYLFLFASSIAIGIHPGNILCLLVLILSYFFFNDKPIPWKISVPIFVILELFSQVTFLPELCQNFMSWLGWDFGHYSYYMNSEYSNAELDITNDMQREGFVQFVTVLFYSSLLILGSEYHNRYKKYVYIYNSFAFGILIFEPFRLAGTFSRLFLGLSVLWFLPLSLVNFGKNKFHLMSKKICYISLLIIYSYLTMFWGRYILFYPDAKYVWDL